MPDGLILIIAIGLVLGAARLLWWALIEPLQDWRINEPNDYAPPPLRRKK